MSQEKFTSDLLDFIEDSPTPFHAVQNMVSILRENGFAELRESDQWSLLPGQNYYVTRNGTSIIAFRTSANDVVKSGVRMVGAHTDSPCLKVKPSPEITQKGYLQLGVEVYGGACLAPGLTVIYLWRVVLTMSPSIGSWKPHSLILKIQSRLSLVLQFILIVR
jgi:aspartyl aminopeptidase